ncbi:MAG: 50S ribosomal protein L1 [Planctomycetota bacterium]|nr:MAG: 50S ribosomal protein L1 [Planctomycetota bacterium]
MAEEKNKAVEQEAQAAPAQSTPDQVKENQAEDSLGSDSGPKKRWYRGRFSNSRRFRGAKEKVDRMRQYEPVEAFKLLKELPGAKFDETVEIVVRLGINPKKTDQLVRGAVSLPHGIGKVVRVIAFAEGDKAEEAKKAGAIEVGSADLAKKIEGGWLDFDVAIASPDMMRHVGRLGRVLGPQGKMPSPKAGTVTPNVAQAVAEFAAGKVEFRTDKGANVHAPLGKRSFSPEQLADNAQAFVSHLRTLKPSQARGAFVTKVTVSSTMGPGIRLNVSAEGSSHA